MGCVHGFVSHCDFFSSRVQFLDALEADGLCDSLFRDWYSMSTLALVATGSTLSVVGWFAPSEAVVKIASVSYGTWYTLIGRTFS